MRWYEALMARNCITDVRGDVLRIGLALYHDDDDIDDFAQSLEGARMNRSAPSLRSPNLVLALLLLAYIFNFLDRQILGILAGPIIADLKLTDAEFGAIAGLAFAILYSVLGVPLAMLADRTSRSRVIAASLIVWSGFTALCGTATGFTQLFFYRLGVGVGEAGGVAPSYALIADYFPPHKRARALAIFSLGVPLGLAAGTLIGAYLASWIDWRAAFVVMGIAGILLAPVMLWVVRDKPRADRAATSAPRLRSAFTIVAAKPSFWLMAAAASSSSLAGYGLAVWTPSVLERSFGLAIIPRGQFLASIFLIGGTAGVFAGGWLADRFGRTDRAWYARLPAIAWLITAPLVRCRPAGSGPATGLGVAADPQRPQHPVARARHDRDPASRAAAVARNGIGQLPVDQQSDRAWARSDVHRHAVGAVQGALRRRGPALCRRQRPWLLSPRGAADVFRD